MMLDEFLCMYVGDSESVMLWEERGGVRRQIMPDCCSPIELITVLYGCEAVVKGLISPKPGHTGIDAVNILVDLGCEGPRIRAALAEIWRGTCPGLFCDASKDMPKRGIVVRESVYSSLKAYILKTL